MPVHHVKAGPHISQDRDRRACDERLQQQLAVARLEAKVSCQVPLLVQVDSKNLVTGQSRQTGNVVVLSLCDPVARQC